MLGILLNYGILLAIIIALIWLNAKSGQWEQVKAGFVSGGRQFFGWLILLACIFVAMGQADVAIKKHDEEIKTSMSGKNGLPASFIAGILSPGSVAGLPTARAMWHDEDGKYRKAAIFVFIMASMLVNIQTTIMRGGFMGWELTGITYGTCLLIAIIVTFLVWVFEKTFG
jgi:uncharacterized membrane protein YraQ (UPF0718 family)